jgi:hypothetical protein
MDGTDADENLIDLTAEDHFMAHLLLAKAFNTPELWRAANAMAMQKSGREVRNRRTFGIIRREAAKHAGDPTIYKFKDIRTGEVFNATQIQLQKLRGMTPSDTSRLVNKTSKVSKGIVLADEEQNISPVWDTTIYEFVYLETGETFNLTRKEFTIKFGFQRRCVANDLVSGKNKISMGFALASTKNFLRKHYRKKAKSESDTEPVSAN